MKGTDWNGNGRVDAGDWYIDYEIVNSNSDDEPNYVRTPKKKKSRRLTYEEMKIYDRFYRKFFIGLLLIFSVLLLETGIDWYLFDPNVKDMLKIIGSSIVILLLLRNIWNHHRKIWKEKKKK